MFYKTYFGNLRKVLEEHPGAIIISIAPGNPKYANVLHIPMLCPNLLQYKKLLNKKLTKRKFIEGYIKKLFKFNRMVILSSLNKNIHALYPDIEIPIQTNPNAPDIIFCEFYKEGEYSYRNNFALFAKNRLNLHIQEA